MVFCLGLLNPQFI